MVDPLIHRFLEDPGGLDEQELDQLVALLRAEPQRAVELREQLLIGDHLSQKLAIDRQNFFAQIEQRIADYQQGEEEMYDQVAELRAIAEADIDKPLRRPSQTHWLKYSLAAALSLVLVAAIAAWQLSSPAPRPVALVEDFSGEVTIIRGSERIQPRIGKAVSTGDQVVSAAGSTIEWKYKDGTTVRMVGDAVGAVNADGRTGAKLVQLDQGELVASISKQERGPMVFATPHATATVRGTELRLVVGRGDTRLDVTEGQVELTRLSDGKTIQVAANESGVASKEQVAIRAPQWPLDRSRAVFLFDGADKPTLCRNPETGNFRSTPLSPQGNAEVGPRSTLILDGGTFASTDAGSELQAHFQRTGQYSLEIALTPSNVDAQGTVLHIGSDEGHGLAVAQVEAMLGFAQKAGGSEFALPLPVIAAGKRIHVVITYDGNRLAAYINGVIFGDALNDVPMPQWLGGTLTLGNTAPAQQPWHGEIVRLAIFEHAMNADEARSEFQRFELVHPQ